MLRVQQNKKPRSASASSNDIVSAACSLTFCSKYHRSHTRNDTFPCTHRVHRIRTSRCHQPPFSATALLSHVPVRPSPTRRTHRTRAHAPSTTHFPYTYAVPTSTYLSRKAGGLLIRAASLEPRVRIMQRGASVRIRSPHPASVRSPHRF